MRIKALCLCAVLLLFLSVSTVRGQHISVKTNGLMLGLASPNIGVELVTGNKTSFEFGAVGCYKPYGKDVRMFGVMPEFKYWISGRPMARFYIGALATAATYGMTCKNRKYDGDLLSLGLTAGYSLVLSSHWNLEFSAGAGGAFFRQNEVLTGESDNSEYIDRNGFKFIPVKLAISIAYIIK